jgi:hypothetical protein
MLTIGTWRIEIVSEPMARPVSKSCPIRWIVERAIAWISRFHRLTRFFGIRSRVASVTSIPCSLAPAWPQCGSPRARRHVAHRSRLRDKRAERPVDAACWRTTRTARREWRAAKIAICCKKLPNGRFSEVSESPKSRANPSGVGLLPRKQGSGPMGPCSRLSLLLTFLRVRYTVVRILPVQPLRSVGVPRCHQNAIQFHWKSESSNLMPRFNVVTWPSRRRRLSGPDFPRLKRR